MQRPFIVAELSASHLGSFDRALKILEAAAEAGADGFKLQCWSPNSMCVSDYVLPDGPWAGRKLRDLYAECFTPWEWFPSLFEAARARSMVPFASAFDRDSVDFLERLGVDRHKVASYEIVDLPLIRHMAHTGKPIILSCGSATESEIYSAVFAAGMCDVTILKCTSAYPAPPESMNLATMQDMREQFGVDVGLSDHSLGIGVAVAAAALGASMIEKHLTLDRRDGGPDAGFAMEPDEFEMMVSACRRAAAAIGTVEYGHGDRSLQRSLWIVKNARAGEELSLEHVASARPALGMPPSALYALVGQRFTRDVKAGEPLTADLIGIADLTPASHERRIATPN